MGFGAMIFSSIVVQVLVSVVPTFKQKTREGGTGEAFIKNMMLYIFIVATVIQVGGGALLFINTRLTSNPTGHVYDSFAKTIFDFWFFV